MKKFSLFLIAIFAITTCISCGKTCTCTALDPAYEDEAAWREAGLGSFIRSECVSENPDHYTCVWE